MEFKILVPYAGSIPSNKALKKEKMSKDSHIMLLHVIPGIQISLV